MMVFGGVDGILNIGDSFINCREFIFPLIQTDENFNPVSPLQTCFSFCNSPVVITAAHYAKIFDDLKPKWDGMGNIKEVRSKIAFTSVMHAIGEKEFGFAPVYGSCLGSNADLAVLLVPDIGIRPTVPFEITQDIDEIITCGFPTIYQSFDFENMKIEKLSIASSEGRVRQFHLNGHYLTWFPTIESDMEVIGGMSGGPVFSKGKGLIGINSTAISESPISQCFWLEHALDISFSLSAIIHYSDGSSFDLNNFTLRALSHFTLTKSTLSYTLSNKPV